MTKRKKKAWARHYARSVAEAVVQDLDKYPETWGRGEIRLLMAEAFTFEARKVRHLRIFYRHFLADRRATWERATTHY